MNQPIKSSGIRFGKFGTQLGFLTIRNIAGWQCFASTKDKHDPHTEMPIIAWSWRDSGYEPKFQSLN